MDITKEQFIDLVLALEHRNLTLGLELSAELGPDDTEVSPEAAAEIERFESLQHAVYGLAPTHGLEGSFVPDEETGKLVVAPDSELDQLVTESVEIMEGAITQDMIIRQKAVELAQALREETAPEEPDPEVLFPKIEALTYAYIAYIQENGLGGLIVDLEPEA